VSRWREPEGVELVDRADRVANREKMVRLLNEDPSLSLPEGFDASDELCVFVNRHYTYTNEERKKLQSWERPTWDRVARTYGRKVVWFKPDDVRNSPFVTGELVYVGDAGTGWGWTERMAVLFFKAIKAWKKYREDQGWPV